MHKSEKQQCQHAWEDEGPLRAGTEALQERFASKHFVACVVLADNALARNATSALFEAFSRAANNVWVAIVAVCLEI